MIPGSPTRAGTDQTDSAYRNKAVISTFQGAAGEKLVGQAAGISSCRVSGVAKEPVSAQGCRRVSVSSPTFVARDAATAARYIGDFVFVASGV
jgi:hypothetical protein